MIHRIVVPYCFCRVLGQNRRPPSPLAGRYLTAIFVDFASLELHKTLQVEQVVMSLRISFSGKSNPPLIQALWLASFDLVSRHASAIRLNSHLRTFLPCFPRLCSGSMLWHPRYCTLCIFIALAVRLVLTHCHCSAPNPYCFVNIHSAFRHHMHGLTHKLVGHTCTR